MAVEGTQIFFKENVMYLVRTCRDSNSLVLGARFSILETRVRSLKHLRKPCGIHHVSLKNPSGYDPQKLKRRKKLAEMRCSRLHIGWLFTGISYSSEEGRNLKQANIFIAGSTLPSSDRL